MKKVLIISLLSISLVSSSFCMNNNWYRDIGYRTGKSLLYGTLTVITASAAAASNPASLILPIAHVGSQVLFGHEVVELLKTVAKK